MIPAAMPPAARLRRAPRRPHAWLWCLLASQLLVAWIWWRFGWQVGLPAMFLSHAPFWWATLVPDSALLSPVLRRLPTDERVAWLTIDDGPSDDTLPILDVLDAHGAKATFFLVGDRARARPDLVRQIVDRGHGVGNHSATHPQAWFWALPPWRIRDEIERTQATLRDLTGATPHWFRAVVGMANPFVASVLKSQGLTRVAWSARGYDAFASNPEVVARRIERTLSPGAIVLLHEGAAHGGNVETVRVVLARLRANGYRLVVPE